METKRDDKPVVNSANVLRALLYLAIIRQASAEVGLLHVMRKCHFDVRLLQRILSEDHINISFSNVQYQDIAPFGGLDRFGEMRDIEGFSLHRSRIPTALFKDIVQDIDIMIAQYGLPVEHQTEEATLRFLSPIFNRLITMFGFAFRNLPESTVMGHIIIKTRVNYYFKTIGSIAVLFIEVNRSGYIEHLDAIAQVIAECNACDWNNAQQGFCIPVYGILCCRDKFEFFLFNGTTDPHSFKYGLYNPLTHRRLPIQLPDLDYPRTARPFIEALRSICEIIFDLLLSGYVSSLKAYNYSVKKSNGEDQPRACAEKWEEAINAAVKALQDFREAEMKRQSQLINDANSIVEEAMAFLKYSVDAIPILDKPEPIMSGWDDVEIERV